MVAFEPVGGVIPFYGVISDFFIGCCEDFFCVVEGDVFFLGIDFWEAFEPYLVGVGAGDEGAVEVER